MNITVLPYITEAATGNQKAASASKSKAASDTDFSETLQTAMKVTAAIAIDALVAASQKNAVDSSVVQDFFDQNHIPIQVKGGSAIVATTSSKNVSAVNSQVDDNTSSTTSTTSTASGSTMEALESALSSASTSTDSLGCPAALESCFNEAAETYQVPVKLLKAIAKAESGFDANAVSKAGAVGIMQLMPSTAESLGVTDSYDAQANIMGGAKLISQLLNSYDNDLSLALAAYNAGSGNVEKYGGIPPFKETQNYVKKVTDYYNCS